MENLVSITIWRGFGLNASHTWTSRATPRDSKPWPSPYESSRNVSFVPSRISSFQIKFHWPKLRSKIMYLLEKEHSTTFRHSTRAYIEPKSIELHSKISSRIARNQSTGTTSNKSKTPIKDRKCIPNHFQSKRKKWMVSKIQIVHSFWIRGRSNSCLLYSTLICMVLG